MDFLKIRKKARERAQREASSTASPSPPPSDAPVLTEDDVLQGALAARLQGLPEADGGPGPDATRFRTWRPGAGSPPTRKSRFLVVNVARRRIALVVDEVREVLRIPRTEIRPAPVLGAGDGPRFFLGVCGGERVGARGATPMRLLLNVKALLDPEVPGEPEAARAQAEASKQA